MQDYVYLRSTINTGYIQKVSKQDYMNNPTKYPYMIPLSAEATRAEQIYEQKVKPNEWKFAAQSFASGLSGGWFEELGLDSEEKELLGKYKQRSNMAGVYNFLGEAVGLLPWVRGARLAARGARAGLAATRAAKAAPAAGALAGGAVTAAGLTAYTGSNRIADLVGQGKNVDIMQGAEILSTEYVKNAAIVGAFGAGTKILGRAAKGFGTGTRKVLSAAGIRRQGQRALDQGHAMEAWGVKAQKVKTGKEAALEANVLKESNRLIGRILKKKDAQSITAHDLLDAVKGNLSASGRSIGRIVSKIDRSLPGMMTARKMSELHSSLAKVIDTLKSHKKPVGVLSGKAEKIEKILEKNVFQIEKKKGALIRIIKPGVLNNVRTTRQLIGHMAEKAKSRKEKGLLNGIYAQLRQVEHQIIGYSSKSLTSVERALMNRYSTLQIMEAGVMNRIATKGAETLAPSVYRDVARSGLLGLSAGGAIGGAMGGTSMFLLGALVGRTVETVAKKTFHRPWHMSIYPDIATQANRFLSGGKFLPEVFARNIQETAVRRSALIQRLSTGVKTLAPDAAAITKLQLFKYINKDLSDDEKRDVFVRLRDTAREIMSDPQKINQVSFGASEVVSQAGGSSFSVQVQMGAVQAMKKLIEAFPKDRALQRADDILGQENLWSKRDLNKIGLRMQAFFEPDAVVEDMISGDSLVTVDQVQFLRFFHPQFFNAVRNAIIMGINNKTLKLSRKDRIRLSYLLKLPIDIATHPKMLNITEQIGNLNLARQAGQKEELRKNLNIERKSDSLKTAAERSLLQEDTA